MGFQHWTEEILNNCRVFPANWFFDFSVSCMSADSIQSTIANVKSIFSNVGVIVLYSELGEPKWYHSPHYRTPWLHDTEEHAASLASSQR